MGLESGLQVLALAVTMAGFCSSVGLTDDGPLTDVNAGPWGAALKAGICSTVVMSKADYYCGFFFRCLSLGRPD